MELPDPADVRVVRHVQVGEVEGMELTTFLQFRYAAGDGQAELSTYHFLLHEKTLIELHTKLSALLARKLAIRDVLRPPGSTHT
ncbi:MAG: hypothetical protein KBO60_18265 [Achromobacter sp.]|nr:hypothetical protein [Achromobacter sp.]